MRNKITLTTLSAIFALAILPIFAFSQNHTFSAPQNMGATVNSSANDNMTGISLDGRSMLLQSQRTGGSAVLTFIFPRGQMPTTISAGLRPSISARSLTRLSVTIAETFLKTRQPARQRLFSAATGLR